MPVANEQKILYDSFLWEQTETTPSEERLMLVAKQVCLQYPLSKNTDCHAVFYPYTGLKSTAKIERGITRIRISDILEDAPDLVLEALVHVLLARANRKKPPHHILRYYRDYLNSHPVETRHAQTRQDRIRKQLPGPVGKYYDLNESFAEINAFYFDNSIEKPTLSWSPKRSRRQLGYHDEHLNLIVISSWLDRRMVPRFVVDFIMYHEMLHIVIPVVHKQGRRIVHTKEFRRREKMYQYYEVAKLWLGG
jgi:hypothetical protein